MLTLLKNLLKISFHCSILSHSIVWRMIRQTHANCYFTKRPVSTIRNSMPQLSNLTNTPKLVTPFSNLTVTRRLALHRSTNHAVCLNSLASVGNYTFVK
uniref:Uncharacterized protein n=1 Tax=Rhizophora mucronata TaxID=61149 RepID=A0A2P2KFY7_RHIMU